MIKNIFKYGVSEGIAKITPFITTLYVAKSLAPELFGMYSLLIALFEVLFIFISFNIQATTRVDYFKFSKNDFYETKRNHITLTLGIAFTILVSLVFIPEEFKLIFVLLVITAVLRTFSVFIMAIFQCEKNANNYILSNITFVLFLSLFIFLFLELGLSFNSWVYAMLIASIFQLMLVVNLFGVKSVRLLTPQKTKLTSLTTTFIPALIFLPQAIGWWLKSGAERIIISSNLGNASLGVYSLSLQFVSVMFIFVTVLNLAIVPEINRLMKINSYKKTHKMLFVTSFFVLGISILIPLIGNRVINYFYTSEYLLATRYLIYLTVASVPQALMMIYINVLYFTGQGKFVAFTILISFSAQTLINLVLIKSVGIFGIIVCAGLVNCIATYLILVKMIRITNGNYPSKEQGAPDS